MLKSLDIVSISPSYLSEQVDSLSSVLAGLQLSAEVYLSGEFCGQWALDTSGSRRVPFHIVGSGNAWLHMHGEAVRRLGSGDLLIFPSDRKHIIASSREVPDKQVINAGPTSFENLDENSATNMVCGFFDFRNKSAWPLLESLDSVIVLKLSDQSALPEARALTQLLVNELAHRLPGYHTSINQLAYLIFIHAIRQQISVGKVQTGLLAALFDPSIGRALSCMHNQPEHAWTLLKLAKAATMGRSSFAKRFVELVGMSVMQYLTYWRMQHAQKLLQASKLSIWQIAEQCGYRSEPAFRKAFKKIVGTPPGLFRRQSKDRVSESSQLHRELF